MASEYNPALDQGTDAGQPPRGVGSFGPVVFQVSEETMILVKHVHRKTAVRVEEHKVIGFKSRLEFLGPELDETTFKVWFSISFGVNPRTEIRRLRDLCTRGVVERLILGGENFGKYLLTGVDENWLHSAPNGAPMSAEASLTIKEYQ